MKSKKRLFIGLISVSLLLIVVLIGLIWFLAVNRETPFYHVLLVVVASLWLVVVVLVGAGIIGMVLTLWQSKTIPSMQNYMRMATNLLFPIALGVGKVFRIDKDTIKNSFIQVNNQMVYTKDVEVKPEQVMILAPHCLQKSNCPYKITLDVTNCKKCGGCSIHYLRDLSDKYGVTLIVATGGTLARKFIEKNRPRAIVAIACERDLTSGILDANPIPVLGVLNERPEGPCYNTTVNLYNVEEAIQYFLTENKCWQQGSFYKEVEG